MKYPELPEPYCNAHDDADSWWPDTYSADQMYEFAAKAVEINNQETKDSK